MTIHKQIRSNKQVQELKTNDFKNYFATVFRTHTQHKRPSLMGKYANGKSRKHHESCESCASILKSLCFFGTKIQFCSEPQKGTTGDHERNDLRGKCFETTQKNIKKRTDFRCVKKCKQKGTRRILECRPPCRLNSASFLLRRTPSQHRNTLGASLQKSVSISSFLLLFTLPNSFSLHLSLSLSSERLGKLPLDCISQIPCIVTWSFDWTPLHPTPVEALISCSSLTLTTIFVQICRKSHKPSEAIQLFQAETF